MWPHPLLPGMRYPGEPFAGLPEGAEPQDGTDETLPARPNLASDETAAERLLWRTGLTMMAVGAVVWVGCTGGFAFAVIRSQWQIRHALESLATDGYQVTREHVNVLLLEGPGKLSPESARALCRADVIYAIKIRQDATPDRLTPEFQAVFDATDVPPYREFKRRPGWRQIMQDAD
jgi:hypothetical protein